MKYSLVGYANHNEDSSFYFVAPVYIANNEFFVSETDQQEIYIKKFLSFNIGDWMAIDDSYETSVGELAIFMFVYNNELYRGNRHEVTRLLYQLIRREDLDLLALYDIYFFLGDKASLDTVISQVTKRYSKYKLQEDNFLKPYSQRINVQDFCYFLFSFSQALKYWNGAFAYDRVFSKDGNTIAFFCYRVPTQEVTNNFSFLIDQYREPEYRDLVVHCFLQCSLSDSNTKMNKDYKLRNLIPLSTDNLELFMRDEDLLRNTQSLLPLSSNALELSCVLTKQIGNEEEKRFDVSEESQQLFDMLKNRIKEEAV